jgi:hypothetical protein
MIQVDYRLIWHIGCSGNDNVSKLYNIETDPEELVDLGKSHSDITF